jgi:hypothetical protein
LIKKLSREEETDREETAGRIQQYRRKLVKIIQVIIPGLPAA